MGRLSELAKARDKGGDTQPAYELWIGRDLYTGRLLEGAASYKADGGTSEMSISGERNLEPYQNEPVKLLLGYGDDLEEWFSGYLNEPVDDHWGEDTAALAYGPFKEIAAQSFLRREDYRNQSLARALLHIHTLARPRLTNIQIIGGEGFVLVGEDAIAGITDKLGDKAQTLMSSANFVGYDAAGYARICQPAPRPRGTRESITTYDESHYEFGAFHAKQTSRGVYSRVRVYRFDDNGNPEFPLVDIPITYQGRAKPPPAKAYDLDDFVGDYAQAKREGQKMAETLAMGSYEFTFENISLNPELGLYRQFDCETTEFRDEGGRNKERYSVLYGCLINGECEVDIARTAIPMSVSGQAIKRRERRLPKPFYLTSGARRRSYILDETPPAPLYGYTVDGRGYVSEDLHWVTYDADTQELVLDVDAAAADGVTVSTDDSTNEIVVEVPDGYNG